MARRHRDAGFRGVCQDDSEIFFFNAGGHIALIGVLTGREGVMPTTSLMVKQARLQGLIVGNRRQQQEFVAALEPNSIRPIIDRSFALEALADAFRMQQDSQHFGKIVVEW